jgi:endonuclease G
MRKPLAALLLFLLFVSATFADSTKDCFDCDPVYGSYPAIQPSTALISGVVPILVNRTYVAGYGEVRMNPLWVCYRVYSIAQVGTAPSHGWRIDGRTEARVSDNDYKYTGYQRGHMAPKSAMYHCYGATAVYDTFQLSNACPQLGELNNGPWGDLEDLIRENYSISCDEVWIIAGPIFDDSNGQGHLAKDAEHCSLPQKSIEIPDAFYKIIIDEEDGEIRILAFIMDHSEGYGYGEGDSIPGRLSGFLVSIDEIEDATGLDFFAWMDEAAQHNLESDSAEMMW